jgi:hypothetical protein
MTSLIEQHVLNWRNRSWAVTAQIEVPDGGGLGKGGTATLYLDGQEIGSGRVERTEPIGFGYEYTDVGRDALSPVTADYPPATPPSPAPSS